MTNIKQNLSSKEISQRAISNARRTVLSQITNRTLRKWDSCSHRKETDPFINHLREVLDFLAEMFELGFEYGTINTHRSAISVFHKPIEVFSVRKHPKVWNLMTGVYNKRSPKPRYWLVWDTETVLRYLRSLPINTFKYKNVNIKINNATCLNVNLKMF